MMGDLWRRLVGTISGEELRAEASRHRATADTLDMALRELMER